MFDMAEFLKTNLIRGYWDGSFTKTQVNIFSMNYLMNGWFVQSDVDEVLEGIQPKEEVEGEAEQLLN